MAKQSHQDASKNTALAGLSLGKTVEYVSTYSPDLLQAVPRSLSRHQIGLLDEQNLPFYGADFWTGYELSWLTPKGKPQIAILQITVPYDSPNLIESKSFKLYLNSFNQESIEAPARLQQTLENDLSKCAQAAVMVELLLPKDFAKCSISELEGENIDDIDTTINEYDLTPDILKTENYQVHEILTSNLLKSNCLITNQPDWASIQIEYRGTAINRESLLKYLVSFRMHNEFHEQCVERVYCDIMKNCKPSELTVFARYTRRGGLDINPYRSNTKALKNTQRNARQ